MDPQARPVIRFGLAVLFTTLALLGAWATLAPIHGAVIALGMVKVESNRKTVQHQEGGIVSEILVRNGDRVEQGQPLIVLHDVAVDATLEMLRDSLNVEWIRHARLEAEQTEQPAIALPPELQALADDPVVRDALQKETLVFDNRRRSLQSQLELIAQQIAETETEYQVLLEQTRAAEEAIGLAREELALHDALHAKNYASNAQVLALRRSVADYRSRFGEYKAEMTKAQQRRTELELRAVQLRSDYARTATEELKESTSRLAELRERIRPSEDAAERQVITAPIAGQVVGLAVHTVGAAIGPREPLLDIVPDDAPLVIEAKTQLDDIDQLYLDQLAEIRFTALNSRTTPMVTGRVSYVSADALTDSEGAPFFLIEVTPDPESLAAAAIPRLAPGMQAEVYVQTAARTLLDYMISPILDGLRRAMREQ